MGVNFKGTPSGIGGKGTTEYSPPVPSGGHPQPVVTTTTSGAIPSTIQFPDHSKSTTPAGDRGTADFMPTGGTNPVDSNY